MAFILCARFLIRFDCMWFLYEFELCAQVGPTVWANIHEIHAWNVIDNGHSKLCRWILYIGMLKTYVLPAFVFTSHDHRSNRNIFSEQISLKAPTQAIHNFEIFSRKLFCSFWNQSTRADMFSNVRSCAHLVRGRVFNELWFNFKNNFDRTLIVILQSKKYMNVDDPHVFPFVFPFGLGIIRYK